MMTRKLQSFIKTIDISSAVLRKSAVYAFHCCQIFFHKLRTFGKHCKHFVIIFQRILLIIWSEYLKTWEIFMTFFKHKSFLGGNIARFKCSCSAFSLEQKNMFLQYGSLHPIKSKTSMHWLMNDSRSKDPKIAVIHFIGVIWR